MISVKNIFMTYILILNCEASLAGSRFKYRTQPAKCYVKTSSMKITDGGLCKILYDKKGCTNPNQFRVGYFNEGVTKINEDKTFRLSSSFINVSLSVFTSGSPVLLLVRGVTSATHDKRCVIINFDNVTVRANEYVTLHTDHLELPDGVYNLTGLGVRPFASSEKKRKNVDRLQLITHRNFDVGNHPKDFKRREARDKECSCDDCIESRHEYLKDSGLLRFYYNLTDDSCSNFTINLLKYKDDPASNMTEEKCERFNDQARYNILKKVSLVGPTRYADKVPVDFPYTSTGCYLIKIWRWGYYGLFWVEAANTTDVKTWNITIWITPRKLDDSIEVSWIPPSFPFNFTSWELTLWYFKDCPSHCDCQNCKGNVTTTVGLENNVLQTNSYTFANLSKGFYCVKFLPVDGRCLIETCTARSSKVIYLTEPVIVANKDEGMPLWVMYVLVIVGIVIGVSLALFCYSTYRNSFQLRIADYTSVSLEEFQLEPVYVLVIWTRLFTEKNPQFESVINAFKNLLRTYSNCKVYDYLDHAKMDRRERQFLMNSPAEWLHTHLQEPKEKIIFIGSRGVKTKQEKGDGSSNGVLLEQSFEGPDDSRDALLFPYVLRYLKESRELSSDYGRIFCVRFHGLYVPENDFGEIVPGMRFTIPNHLRSLTLKLRGLTDETSSGFPHPPEEQINNLQNLINKC